MLWLRKIIFYIFLLIYLVLCPLIVARMLGFVINPLTYRMVKTGLVYISTNPPNASVYIDGRLANQKTPTILRDLAPGKHFIRIELVGYNDWERHIPVVGKKATLLANTLLIPQEWPIKIISNRTYQNILYTADDILIATNPVLKNIDIFHAASGNEENLFSQNSIYANGALENLYNIPQSPFILLQANIKDHHKFLWVNLKGDPPLIEDISDFFVEVPTRITWDNADNDNIFAFYPDHIYRINIKDKAIYPQSLAHLPQDLSQQPANNPQEKFLINDNNDLLIRQGSQIRIYPKEEFDAPHVYDIAMSRPSTNMYFDENTGELFYLDYKTGYLYAAQILPQHPILNIPIPDAIRATIPTKESIL